MEALLKLLVLIACGVLYVGADRRPRPVGQLLALGHLTGAAALAFGVTLGLAVLDRVDARFAIGSLLALAAAGLIRHARSSSADNTVSAPEGEPADGAGPGPSGRWNPLLVLLIGVGLLTAASRVFLLPLDWDGWAIWQLKARAMTSGQLKELLTDPRYQYSHQEYPLLVPSHTWWLSGSHFSARLAQVGGLLFLLDLFALFYYEARARVGSTWALAGGAALLSWALIPKHTASGFSDIPMAAFAFGAMTFLVRGELRLLVLLLTGALLTKNEGLFTLGACLVVAALPSRWVDAAEPPERRAQGPGSARRFFPLGVVLATAAATLLPWVLVKRRWEIPSEFLDPRRWPHLDAAEIVRRLWVVTQGFAGQFVSVGPWYPGWGFTWFLALLGLGLSLRHRLRTTLPYWLLVAAHFAGATLAYLLTHTSPALHLSRSLDRLMLHVAPAALLATLVAVVASAQRKS